MISKKHLYYDDLSFYFKDLNKCKILSEEEMLVLYKKYKEEGCLKSREALCQSCMVLTFKLVKKYVNQNNNMFDLISEANYALFQAVENWNPEVGALTTVVSKYVNNQLLKYVMEQGNGVIRIARTTYKDYRKLEKLPLNLDVDEICKITGKKRYRVLQLLDSMPIRDIKSIDALPKNTDIVEETQNKDLFYMMDVPDSLKMLNKKDQEIVKGLYGIGRKKQSMNEIASKLKVTKWYVWHRRDKILKYLKENHKPWQKTICIKCEDSFYKPESSSRSFCYSCKPPISQKQQLVKN